MHGKSGTGMILNLTPMSEEDQEQDRLRDAAFHSQKITSGEYSLDDYDCPSGSRSPDDVLSDSMGGGDESMLFDMATMPRFARAMGASEDEIAQIIHECLSVITHQGVGSREHWIKVGMAIHSTLPT